MHAMFLGILKRAALSRPLMLLSGVLALFARFDSGRFWEQRYLKNR